MSSFMRDWIDEKDLFPLSTTGCKNASSSRNSVCSLASHIIKWHDKDNFCEENNATLCSSYINVFICTIFIVNRCKNLRITTWIILIPLQILNCRLFLLLFWPLGNCGSAIKWIFLPLKVRDIWHKAWLYRYSN